MSSGSEFPDPTSFLDRLFSSRSRENHPTFLSFMSSLPNPQNETSTNSDQNNPQQTRERLILINPLTQTMLVIERSNNRERDRDRNSSDDDSIFDSWIHHLFLGKEGQPPASKASMDAMPEMEIKEKGEECMICLEELEFGLIGKEMPCKHRFHGGCIEKWLKIHGTCPVCRYKMPVEERNDTAEKSEENESERGSGSGGRRRGEVWMGFTLGDDDGSRRRSGENHQSETD